VIAAEVNGMNDILPLVLIVGLYVLSWALVAFCARLSARGGAR
jgi:hypothetical protein